MSDEQTDWLSRKHAPTLANRIRDYWWEKHRLLVNMDVQREVHGSGELYIIRSNISQCLGG